VVPAEVPALNSDGSFRYTPDAGFTGIDTFRFRATDTHGDYAIGTATIEVTPAVAPTTPPVAPTSAPPAAPTTSDATETADPTASPTDDGTSEAASVEPSDPTSTPVVPEPEDDDPEPAARENEPDRSELDAPSVLTDSIPTAADILEDPTRIAQALASGLVWTLLLVVAMVALNRALKSRYDRLAAMASRLRAPAWLTRLTGVLGGGHWAAALTLISVNACLVSLVDPHAGFDATTARLVLSIIIAQLLVSAVPYLLSALRSRWLLGVPASVRTLPVGLVMGGLGVAISRLIGFIPGLLYGATLRLAQTGATVRQIATTERFAGAVTMGIGFACWALADAIPSSGPWLTVLAHDAAVAATIIAFLNTLVEMMPLSMFPGGVLFQHARWSWMALATSSMVAFMLFVVPQPKYWIYVGDGEERWLAIASVAVLAAVAVLTLLHRRDRAAEAPEPSAT
jgi:hypothetical protein